MSEWRLGHLADIAEQLVSELVAAAVATTGGPEPRRYTDLCDKHLTTVTLRMQRRDGQLLITVHDRNPEAPALHAFARQLVEALSCGWGHQPDPSTGGKIVWCRLDLYPAPARTSTASAPPAHNPFPGVDDPHSMDRVLHEYDADTAHDPERAG